MHQPSNPFFQIQGDKFNNVQHAALAFGLYCYDAEKTNDSSGDKYAIIYKENQKYLFMLSGNKIDETYKKHLIKQNKYAKYTNTTIMIGSDYRFGSFSLADLDNKVKETIIDTKNLNGEQKLLVATIYGESTTNSITWKALAHIINNRIGVREWKEYTTVTDVIKNSGFDSYSQRNNPFVLAENYLNNRDYSKEDIENVIQTVSHVYYGYEEDITGNAVLYYSPDAQKALHKQYPNIYKSEIPEWDFSLLEEVYINGIESNKFRFFRYK